MAFRMMVLVLSSSAAALQTATSKTNGIQPAHPQTLVERASLVKKVHVVFSNHLDVGYTGDNQTPDLAIDVVNLYFDLYFARALNTSSQLRARGSRYIYTTHSWLASLYLDCPKVDVYQAAMAALWPHRYTAAADVPALHCPLPHARAAFVDGVRRGDIVWHAFPHNAQMELMDSTLFSFGVKLTHRLDANFSLPPKRVLSLRDVPGCTRAVVPLLADTGVRAISIGMNDAVSPPGVPRSFVWRDVASGKEVLAFYHFNGYGGTEAADCVIAGEAAIATAWRVDNSGPHGADEALNILHQVQRSFPNATTVVASTFDAFVEEALAPARASLPVFTGEIGDTWFWGVPSDPRKVAEYRLFARLRAACVSSKRCDELGDRRVFDFSRWLIKIPEHTAGENGTHDYTMWSNAQVRCLRGLVSLSFK